MSSKIKLVYLGIFLVILLFNLIIYSVIKPRIKFDIKGEQTIHVEVNSLYKDLGADASLYTIFQNKKLKVTTTENVNVNKIGKYKVNYQINVDDKVINKERIVIVEDNTKPEINILDEVVSCNGKVKDFNYTAYDNYDGDITYLVKKEVLKDKVILKAADSNKNVTEKTIKIKSIDAQKPQISLNGSETIILNLNDTYTEYGAVSYDSCDGDLNDKIEIVSDVNTSVLGNYTVVYKVSDSYGNTTMVTRNVYVKNAKEEVPIHVPADATIYLTFDDGPGQYTEELLNILDNYNIKATFFVTNQFPKYQYLIKEEATRGHTIGVHTYSHLWSVYSSVDEYMNDFNAMNTIIYNQTGKYAKIFRFPGGSSNTISRRYCLGIMTTLANKMISDGYQYYDWNMDSTDTASKNTVDSIINNVKRSLKGNSYYIVLMHDIKKNTIQALPTIIEYAKSIGYNFKPITEETPIVHSHIAN